MILHYLRISWRNLRKYKTQTAISICAMAVSLTLMAIVSSIILSYKPTPLLSQPYADRVEQFATNEISRVVTTEERALIMGHQFKSVEDIYISSTSLYPIRITANHSVDKERTMIDYGGLYSPSYLNFLGVKSIYSGKKIGVCASNEVVITDWLARRLFDDENPVGKTIVLKIPYLSRVSDLNEEEYIIKDVIGRPSFGNEFMYLDQHIYLFPERFPDDVLFMYFKLREGASREDLQKELAELLPNKEFLLYNVKTTYDQSKTLAIRKSVIIFLFLFVLVSFANYMRQQTQLFHMREREVALRTCVGSPRISLFSLFATELMLVLILTLALALVLTSIVIGFLTSNFYTLIESHNYNFDTAYPILLITTLILVAISIIATILTVKRIRQNQTGLALRMKPIPKHRMRNVGLIVQMSISILFLWVAVLYFLTVDSIKEWYGIPEDVEKYKNCLIINMKEVALEDYDRIYSRIDSLPSVEKMYKYSEGMSLFDPNEGFPNYSYYYEIFQNNDDMEDFYNLNVTELPGKVNLDRYVLISEDFKQMLIDKNLWNGKTVSLPNREQGEFEIKGVFERIPFKDAPIQNVVINVDRSRTTDGYGGLYERIILHKKGMEREVKKAIENILGEELPTRVDIKIDNFFDSTVNSSYSIIRAIITIIYILSAISVITTLASVYAGVSLDTRRRRKEMALRKLNGAGRKVIAMIFLRTYIVIVSVAALIALPLGIICIPKLINPECLVYINLDNMVTPYLMVILFVFLVTACTIAWKIRDVMNADPVEYLKE